jgi:hypothetical protein
MTPFVARFPISVATCAGVALAFFSRKSAAIPATWGAAADVPDKRAYSCPEQSEGTAE